MRILGLEHNLIPVVQQAPRSREALHATLVVEVVTVTQLPAEADAADVCYTRVSVMTRLVYMCG